VHDGLVHRRFPVGPIADLPAMKRIVVAHQLHHSDKYKGVPFGMFLGPQVGFVRLWCGGGWSTGAWELCLG
jgi:beta-carotene 3-hydroxylase